MRVLPRSRSWSVSAALPSGAALVAALVAALLAALLATGPTGCAWIESARPRPQPVRAAATLKLDVPSIMRGTIASETIVLGYRPTIVRGYGLVVGLDGTGSGDIPPGLRAHMITEMSRRGIGDESKGFGRVSPEEMLNDVNTAVVVVEGVLPGGAVGRQANVRSRAAGTRFDVRVFADPRTGTTSLEGGRLYTAALRPVQLGELLPPVGSHQAAIVAEAGGPVFVNPFAEAAAAENIAIRRTTGRIMNGGEAQRDLPIKLRLATPSHSRAETIQNSINARFPQERGQIDPTARGQSDELIRITVPPSYRHDTDEFIQLLRHSTIRQSGAEMVAMNLRRRVLRDPSFAVDVSWRWQALGVRVLPIIQSLYDHAEEAPRLAALRAGAKLDDPRAIPFLIAMAQSATPDSRHQAVALLGDMRLDPRIDQALRRLLDDDDIDVRLGAYEALTKRFDPFIDRSVIGGTFVLDVVDSAKPLIYITQIGQPRVAIFGRELSLERPILADAWSGRLMVKAAAGAEKVDVYYRPSDGSGRTVQRVSPRLDEFVRFLGHDTTVNRPEAGLGLSYGETVGTVYEMWRQQYVRADFKAEQDRVLAAIRRQQQEAPLEARPEFSDPDFDFLRTPAEPEPAAAPASDASQAAIPAPGPAAIPAPGPAAIPAPGPAAIPAAVPATGPTTLPADPRR